MADSPRDEAPGQHAGPRPGRGEHPGEVSSEGDGHGDPLFVGVGAICDTATRLTGVDGAAVAVLTSSQSVRELVYATDAVAQQVDELQFVLGQGPCLDAYHQQRPQMCAHLDDHAFESPWPAFASEAAALGVAAVFAYPVPGSTRPIGVLELYRRTGGELGDAEQRSAQVCAAALQMTIESNWGKQLARSTSAEAAIETAALRGTAGSDPFTRHQVHVAAGMVAVQLAIATHEGLDRLRAYAYAQRRSIVAVAADVVSRRLSFTDLNDGESSHDA